MKRNRFLLILTILIVIIGSLFLINREYTTLDDAESGFAVEDTASITKIFIVDKNNNSVKLTKQAPGKWILNDDLNAHNYYVTMLLRTMKELTVRYPVPMAARDNVIRRMASIGRKVEVYQEVYRINLFDRLKLFPHEKLTRVYYVGDATQDNRGTYMLMEDATQPYVVFLPSLRGFIATRYSTDIDSWREQIIFRTPLQEFSSVTIEFLEEPEESFIVRARDDGNFSLELLENGRQMPYDTLRMLQFVTAFKDIRYESNLNNKLDAAYIDSIASGPMAHIISLAEKDGDTTLVKTFRKGGFSQIFEDVEGVSMHPFDLDRLYAYLNDDKDFVLIQYFVFDRVLRTASYLRGLE